MIVNRYIVYLTSYIDHTYICTSVVISVSIYTSRCLQHAGDLHIGAVILLLIDMIL